VSVVVPFPRSGSGDRLDLGRLVPSGRSLLVAFAVVLGTLAVLILVRESAIFGVRTIAVEGAPAGVSNQVERALRRTRGESLVALDLDAARREVLALSTVAAVSFDRAYPHTLRVAVTPERPVAVVRQGAASTLVSERGRVIAQVERGARPELARVWAPRSVVLTAGELLDGDLATAIVAVSPLAGTRFPARVTSVTVTESALTLRLRSGLELRLGDTADVELKLAVAAKVLPLVRPGSTYLDVSAPERPVAGLESAYPQVEPEPQASTAP
jgi:cell division protein FtsQ